MIVSEIPKRSNSRWLQIYVLLCAMVVLPLGIASAQDYSAVAKRLKRAVKKDEITQEQADIMMAALKKEKSPEADDERDIPASRSRKPLGPVPPYATRAEGKLEFDKKIDLHFSRARIATSSIVLGNSTPSILFSNREGRIVAQLPININTEFGGTWWVQVGLLDDAGKIVAADEQQYTMEETVRIRDLSLIVPHLTHTLDFDLGSWKERSIATRFAVTVEQYPPLMTRQFKMQPGESVARQQPLKLEEPAKIDLRHPSGSVVQWIAFRHEKDRLRGELHVSFPSGPKAAWKAGVELLDEAGKTLAEGETRFENDGLVRDHLAFVRLKAFEFDFGPCDDVSNVKRLAVNIGQLAPGDNSITGGPLTREAGRAVEVPSPAELLAKLKATDSLYRRGFTVTGTSVHGWPKTKHEWRLTMGNGQVALLQRAVEILDQKENRAAPEPDAFKYTLLPIERPRVDVEKAVFVTPEYCAQRWCQKNTPVDLDLPEPGGYRHLSFMSVTSALYTREVFWVMGRGLAEHIQEITKVSREADGKLKVVVITDLGLNPPCELIVEPEADYMIRWGKLSYACTFSNSGLKRISERCVPLKGKWDGAEVVFEEVSAEPDQKFLQEVEKMMHPPYATLMPVRDERVWPPLAAEFFEMRRGEGIRIGQIVVPIHCKGISHPDGKKKFETRQSAPRQTAEQFLAAFLKGDEEAVNDLIAPGSMALADLAGLRKAIGDAAALEVRCVRFAGERAVILTTDIPLGSDPALKAPVFLRLAKQGDRWLIERIESLIEESFTRRLARLLSERN
jgi:hypothetical protein